MKLKDIKLGEVLVIKKNLKETHKLDELGYHSCTTCDDTEFMPGEVNCCNGLCESDVSMIGKKVIVEYVGDSYAKVRLDKEFSIAVVISACCLRNVRKTDN